MQGIVARRLGHNVTILEQSLSATREGQAAGIVTMEHSHRFMSQYDLLKDQPYAVNCSAVQILDSNLKVKHEFQRPMKMSSWNVLYYRFRANFDGLKSFYVSKPPPESKSAGLAHYRHGCRVIGSRVVDDKVNVEYEDLVEHTASTLLADLVIVADGSASQMRGLMQPQLQHTYAGYVAWRGTVDEDTVSDNTRRIFKNKTTLHSCEGGYIALWVI